MPSQAECKEIFALYDEEMDGKIDATQIGEVVRACGLKPSNKMVHKAAGKEYTRKGEKRMSFEEWYPIYEQLGKEKDSGNQADFVEMMKMFDKEGGSGKLGRAEIKQILQITGERMSAEEAEEILKGAEDPEGQVNYEEWIKKVLAGPYPEGD